jgi:hypothetical protein
MSEQGVMPTPIFDELVSELHIEITFEDVEPAVLPAPAEEAGAADRKAS